MNVNKTCIMRAFVIILLPSQPWIQLLYAMNNSYISVHSCNLITCLSWGLKLQDLR